MQPALGSPRPLAGTLTARPGCCRCLLDPNCCATLLCCCSCARTQVFGLMNLIIERLGEDITPHVQGLLPLLPQIWQEANDQSLLRIQVGLGFVYGFWG